MISSLVDGVLLLALVITSCVVGAMYVELRRHRQQRTAHQLLLSQTAETLAAIDLRIGELNARGHSVLRDLSERVAEARLILSDLDGAHGRRPVAERGSALHSAASHTVPTSSKH